MKIEDEIKGRFRNEYHKGLINLNYTFKQIDFEFSKMLKSYGLTEPQYNVLRILRGFRSEAPLSISFIKERMVDKVPDVSRLVDRLYKNGFINRFENPNDRRHKTIEITEKGLKLLDKMYVCEEKADTLLQNLNLDEVKELNRLLDKIRDTKE